jgi:SAM-dependent methyltransferase
MKVDLGCGLLKTTGFLGVDRFPLPGVDVVCDLDQGIPFANDSVDYILASHSLEHVADLPAMIQEIFRVSRDRAIVTIISPYYATGLNSANPYHKQVFNEHTSRFFTMHEAAPPQVAPEEYAFPHADVWGLGQSDHSDWRADLRPLHVEYFYFGPYRALDETSKREFRRHLFDVCDQMLTHLLVVKTPISEEEFAHIAETAQFQETESLRIRRQTERQQGEPDIFSSIPGLPRRLDGLEKELTRVAARTERALVAALSAEVKKLQLRIEQGEADQRRLDTFVTRLVRDFVTPRSRGERGARILRELLLPTHDLAHDLAVSNDPLLEASLLGNGVTSAHRLRFTSYVVEGDHFVYPITFRDERVHGVDLRLFVMKPPREKVHLLHLTLYDPEAGQVLRSAEVLANENDLLQSVRVTFSPLAIGGVRMLQVRLLGMEEARTAGLRMLEWRRPRLFSRMMYDRRLFGRVVRSRL